MCHFQTHEVPEHQHKDCESSDEVFRLRREVDGKYLSPFSVMHA